MRGRIGHPQIRCLTAEISKTEVRWDGCVDALKEE
jgi:hypothetical protein